MPMNLACLKGRAPIGDGDWEFLQNLIAFQKSTYVIDKQVECHIFKGLGGGALAQIPRFSKSDIILDLGGNCEFTKVASLLYYSGDDCWSLKVYDPSSVKVDGKKLPMASLVTVPISKPSVFEVEGTASLWRLEPQEEYEEIF